MASPVQQLTRFFAEISSILSALAAVVGLFLLWFQVRNANKSLRQLEDNQLAELKPYLSLSLNKGTLRNDPAVLLRITNHGRTPATGVRIVFAKDKKWHHVQREIFPFTSERGISILAPGETKTYFLGRLGVDSTFDHDVTHDLVATVEWLTQFSKNSESQEFMLGISDGRFAVS